MAVITEAILRLIPLPPASETMMAIFDDLLDSGRAISKVLTSGILPAKMELMDQASIVAVENYQPSNLPVDAEAILLIEVDGHPKAVIDEIHQIGEICREAGARDIRIAKSPAEKEELWKARKLVSPAIVKIKLRKYRRMPRCREAGFRRCLSVCGKSGTNTMSILWCSDTQGRQSASEYYCG